ncbi:PAS domain-containing protein [Streptomyces sp. YC419]|uniref:PAS domain-containing protein n=1 Tax=Streptomyces ureilyticus TaxID=1775131 RepID=A0ABX0DP10_9ACTN|nr:PAS domain-containing protein [Streptomyces ureilyticus]
MSPSTDQSGLYLAYLDTTLTIRQANRDFFGKFGGSSTKVLGRSFCHLVHPNVRRPLGDRVARLLAGRRPQFSIQAVIMLPEGRTFTGVLTAVAVHGDSHRVAAVLVVIRARNEGEEREAEVETEEEVKEEAEEKKEGDEGEAEVVTDQEILEKEILMKVDAQIIEGMAEGMSTAALAERVHLSRQGVEYRVTGLLRRFAVPNRTALVSSAYTRGILLTDAWPPRVNSDFSE